MIGSLKIMHFGFLISVIVAVLIIGKSLDSSAQGTEVECPCDFESVPMTTECWTEGFLTDPAYIDDAVLFKTTACLVGNLLTKPTGGKALQITVGGILAENPAFCIIDVINPGDGCTGGEIHTAVDITPEELRACQCELLAYTTALNEVAGISVSPGPPYECGDVDCRQKVLTPIPTLNEYGMIITAGVLGLLAVIGFVMRRKKVSA